MFSDFLRRLTAPDPDRLAEPDAQIALAALLVRIARADGDYATAEIARIDRILASRYALTPEAAGRIRAQAEGLEAEAPDTVRFTRALKDAVPYEERTSIVEALWDVALADGTRDYEEDALVRLVAPMLGVEDQDSALARQRVVARRS